MPRESVWCWRNGLGIGGRPLDKLLPLAELQMVHLKKKKKKGEQSCPSFRLILSPRVNGTGGTLDGLWDPSLPTPSPFLHGL